MKKLAIFTFFLVMGVVSYGQSADSLSVVPNPEKPSEFKGGLNGWVKFLENNLDRDLLSRNRAPVGKYTVIGSFLIDTAGDVSDIRIISDPGYEAAKEFIRMINLSGKKKGWMPAMDHGKPVLYRHKQSLTFVISER